MFIMNFKEGGGGMDGLNGYPKDPMSVHKREV